MSTLIHDPGRPVDPLGDGDQGRADGTKKNFAKVGSSRPSSLLYTYGPGALMDLPHFTVMPTGLDDWDLIWARRDGIPSIHAPRLLEEVRLMLGPQVQELRPFPWQGKKNLMSREGADLGIPARVFPQWMRCTGCDRLARLTAFTYRNTHPFRTDEAVFEHAQCNGRRRSDDHDAPAKSRGPRRQPVVAARYLLACARGHLDEFPYDGWVHHWQPCPSGDQVPVLKMSERTASRGANATIICQSCEAKRPMNEAQGEAGRAKLPPCRGRQPHLDGFEPEGCARDAHLMVVGASNLWFPALTSIIVVPRLDPEQTKADDADRIRTALGDKLAQFADSPDVIRALLDGKVDVTSLSDSGLAERVLLALHPQVESEEARAARREAWDPVDLLVPEWRYLQQDPGGDHHADALTGLTLSPRQVSAQMPEGIARVLAVDRLRKVNALLGFTRIDEIDRISDVDDRLVALSRDDPRWAVATEDRGEGIFVQFAEAEVSTWEERVLGSPLWTAHRDAHRRNFENRSSETADKTDPDERLRPPRYWLLHTFSHALIREMAMYSGYGAASISERLYAWPEGGHTRPAAAGVLIATTASDSEGTLGGLVRLSDEDLLAQIVRRALHRAGRCSSDPVCARRTPQDPEDFLHGAACHCCTMASETSCERANRFLDRRFLLSLPGSGLGFFGDPYDW